jgi:hypothetical protein
MIKANISRINFTCSTGSRKFRAFVTSLGLALCPLALPAASVTLGWNPSPGANVAGYMLYQGTDALYFDSQVDAGPKTFVTVTGLQPGSTNYFEVVAYDANYDESPPSSQIECVVQANGTVVQTGASAASAPTNNLVRVTVQTRTGASIGLFISGNGTLAPNCKGRAFVPGRQYTLTAIAAKGWVFDNWVNNGIVVASNPRYTFYAEPNLVLQANFIPNPFIPVAGAYHGLFYVANDPTEDSSGPFSATVTTAGAFDAKLQLAGRAYSFSGKFSIAGTTHKSIPRPGLSPITVQLQLGLPDSPMTGTISDGAWLADLAANPAVYSKANPAPQTGKYTLVIPGSGNAAAQPGGNGFGAVTVSDSGNVSFSGLLGDGTPVTSTGTVSGQGQWPFYVSLYGDKGSILGWLSFVNDGGINGQLSWFKLPQTRAKLYPGGFTISTEAVGSTYLYTNGLPALGFTEGQLSLADGNLPQSITNQVVLGPANQSIQLTFKTSSGLFKGSVINPETGRPIAIEGIVLQSQDVGAGFFLGTSESGSALLSPAQ